MPILARLIFLRMKTAWIRILRLCKICSEIRPFYEVTKKSIYFKERILSSCLLTYQWRRNACRNADKPSMRHIILIVIDAHAENMQNIIIGPKPESIFSPIWNNIFQSTSDNSTMGKIKIRMKDYQRKF